MFIILENSFLPPDFFEVDFPKPSKNRSKRVLKKLLKKMRLTARPKWLHAFVMGDKIICHPTLAHRFRQEIPERKQEADFNFNMPMVLKQRPVFAPIIIRNPSLKEYPEPKELLPLFGAWRNSRNSIFPGA